MKKICIVILFITLSILSACNDFEGGTSKSMQEDFDKIRLDHILIISNLVKEYKEKTGKYPFETNPLQLPIAVIIQSKKQRETHKGKVPLALDLETRATNGKMPPRPKRIDVRTVQELTDELSHGLQRPITLPFDHQKVPVNKPSVYVYTYYLGVFDVTAFLHNEQQFARPLGNFNNKITVGNKTSPQASIWTSEDLTKQESFRGFFQSPFNKGGYTIKTTI